ncbi:MAG: hypothetical protein ACR2NU_00330, partial [Aeoliella sp.]
MQTRLESELSRFIRLRSGVTFGPLWRLTIDPPTAVTGGFSDINSFVSDQDLTDARRQVDKLIVLVVREGPFGYAVAAQEYDCLLESWGPVIAGSSTALGSVPELCFANLQEAFTPMAKFRVIRDSPDKVELSFRGSALPQISPTDQAGIPGQVLRPVLRRIDREGQPVEGGIQPVAWTYLRIDSLEEEATEGEQMT